MLRWLKKLFGGVKASSGADGLSAKGTICRSVTAVPGPNESKERHKPKIQPPSKPPAGNLTKRTCRTCGKDVIGKQELTTCPHCGKVNPGWVHVLDKPKDPRVVQLLAAAGDRYARGQKREALAEFLRAAELDPNEAAICSNIGAVYGELGEHEAAIRYLKKALSLDPNLGSAQRMLSQIEQYK